MQKKYSLSFPIDAALDRRIAAEVKRTGLSRADIARTALRAVLLVPRRLQGGTTHEAR